MKSNFRQAIFNESLRDLRHALLMQRANERALELHIDTDDNKSKIRETIQECKDKAKQFTETAEHQIKHLEQDLLDVQMDIEMLGGGDFAELVTEQNSIENRLQQTKRELQNARNI